LLKFRNVRDQLDCKYNLALVHQAFRGYADDNGGNLPPLEREGPLAAAGTYAVRLADGGYLKGVELTRCPAVYRGDVTKLPSETDLRAHFGTETYQDWIKKIGGCYGYHLGYVDHGQLVPITVQHDHNTPILADRPFRPGEDPAWNMVNSPNHGMRGQNVLFLGGHVNFIRGRSLAGDDLFLNELQRLAAGRHSRDAVLAPSEFPPGD
jgi:hypothetical protein